MSAKLIILGMKQRGLYLAAELARKGFDVTWMDVLKGRAPDADFPWHVGTATSLKSRNFGVQNFVKHCFKLKEQKGLQILTPEGPIEFSSEFFNRALARHFPNSAETLKSYFEAMDSGHLSLISAIEKKLLDLPLSDRWCLEWSYGLLSSRDETFKSLAGRAPVNPGAPYLFFESPVSQSWPLCQEYAEKAGVKIVKDVKILDIGMEGSRVRGIEIEDVKGFRPCDHLILSCPSSHIQAAFPHVGAKIDGIVNNGANPKLVWVKYIMKTAPNSRPSGLSEISSFVIDPCMPLEGSQFALLEWRGDSLSVWCRIEYEEAKKQSVLNWTGKKVQENLEKLIPSLSVNRIETVEPDPAISEIGNRYVYGRGQKLISGLYKKNLWFAGPETDGGLDLLSNLETEDAILNAMINRYSKELKGTNDRKIHPPADGQNLVN